MNKSKLKKLSYGQSIVHIYNQKKIPSCYSAKQRDPNESSRIHMAYLTDLHEKAVKYFLSYD